MTAMAYTVSFRALALLLVTVLLVVCVTPAPVEAVEALTIVAIAGLVVAGIVLIAYLIVANVEGDKRGDGGRVIWVACAASEGCASAPLETVAAVLGPVVDPADRQGP
jgi:hypothetical protein